MSLSFSSEIGNFIYNATLTMGFFASLVLAILYVKQNSLLYFPAPSGFPISPKQNPPNLRSPKEYGTHGNFKQYSENKDPVNFEENFVVTPDDQKLHTWLIYHTYSNNVPTLIYFHGNTGNMGFRLPNAMKMFAKSNINVLMMDYRGYGNSTGTPTESGLNIDAEAILLYASNHPRLQGSPIIVFGRSLGGAVGISIAHKYPNLVKAVIVENTFLSIGSMVDAIMPAVKYLKNLILRIEWNSEVKITELKMPIMFIAGVKDELVPHQQMLTLHKLATSSIMKELYVVLNGTHNDTFERAGSQYYVEILNFLNRCFGKKEAAMMSKMRPPKFQREQKVYQQWIRDSRYQ